MTSKIWSKKKMDEEGSNELGVEMNTQSALLTLFYTSILPCPFFNSFSKKVFDFGLVRVARLPDRAAKPRNVCLRPS